MPSASRCWEERQQNCLAATADNRMAPLMTNWIETYRGTVPPWECDVTEHFTIAYYFDRLEEAEPNLADALSLGDRGRAGGVCPPARCSVRARIARRQQLSGRRRRARRRGRLAARPSFRRLGQWR